MVTATGMAAITLVRLPHSRRGARIVAPHDCYGGTYRLFDAWHQRGEREVEFVDFGDEAAVRAALSKPTRCCGSRRPAIRCCASPISRTFAALGHASGALVVVDNTFLSPAWQQPLHARRGSRRAFDHQVSERSQRRGRRRGRRARDTELHEQLVWWANCLGVTGAPFDSFMTLRGLRTLHARLDASRPQRAWRLAQWLNEQPGVKRVYYPGLPTSGS